MRIETIRTAAFHVGCLCRSRFVSFATYRFCSNVWPPLRADADGRNMGVWKVIARDDGTKQRACGGKPVYDFAIDKAPGEKAGEHRGNGASHVATP